MQMKDMAKWAAAAAVFAVLGWTGLYLWWHFKILGALNTLESRTMPAKGGQPRSTSVPEEAEQAIEEAGCRAMHYLVGSVQTAKNQAYLVVAYELMTLITTPTAEEAGIKPPLRTPLPPNSKFTGDDPESVRDSRAAALKTWWLLHCKEYHQGWRVWSERCPPPKR
jgi:hypothetical protein